MPSTISDWVDVRIVSRLDAGEVLGLLDDPTVQGGWQEGETVHLYWPSEIWSLGHLVKLRQILRQLDGSNEPEIQVHALPHQDWNQQWAQSVKPLWIGKRIVIRPSWEGVTLGHGQFEIILDPKQAFGTGHHATTRMLLEWLEEVIHGDETVLDVGSGSGILAMAALRLGARSALGIEYDPVAVECAEEYAKQNGFGSELRYVCGTLQDGAASARPDLVLANLDRQTLLQLAEQLALCAARRLLISGLLQEQRKEVVAALVAAGLYPGREREQDGWLAMEFLPVQSCEGV
ncbi:MAG: methyltransferase domain-containing protein [Nitrospira sp.]|nr:methyltransferase domain-containing protein [Nitrospira sp.]